MWKMPPIIKIYEALGAVADERIQVTEHTAKCFSSSGNKHYDVVYDPGSNSIMTNDNGSYWKGYLGYPAIAFLLKRGILEYNEHFAMLLKGVSWKELNQEFKNDFERTLEHIFEHRVGQERREAFEKYTGRLMQDIEKLGLHQLGKRTLPPKGY